MIATKLDVTNLNNNTSTIVIEQKNKLEQSHKELLKQAEKLGEQDGTLNLPQADDLLSSPNEGVIKAQYQKMIADCWNRGKPFLDAPHLNYKVAMEKIENFEKDQSSFFQNKMEIIEQKKQDKMTHLNLETELQEVELTDHDKTIQRDLLAAKKELEKVQNKTNRTSPLIHFKSKFWYFVLLIGIGLAEVPLNLQIFQKFGEAFFITIIMASSLAISIPVLAHFTGVFIKQRKEKKEFLTFAILSILLFLVFNFGVSIFRAYVLAENIGSDTNNLNIVIFTSLNLILFIIGMMASYFRHDESYELEHSFGNFQKEKEKYDLAHQSIHSQMIALQQNKNSRIKAINEDYIREKEILNQHKEELSTQRDKAIKIYDELLNSFAGLEAEVNASYHIAIEKYRAANLVHRKNHRSPKSWAKGISTLNLRFEKCMELDPN